MRLLLDTHILLWALWMRLIDCLIPWERSWNRRLSKCILVRPASGLGRKAIMAAH
ncbi:MAG: hypothetical protein Q8L97_06225 [Nitrosomonas sp.]|uniref:hypothetical protein n=1 Tax=Nitrosomonas sp. TaxID=42353 RepID=UPI002730CFF6|nr:hypothetical protein [Nitrosomonas sp.]MDP1549742.1 hypothetical protein [Nitrosomonas sp.]